METSTWSTQEESELRKRYLRGPWSEILCALPGRSKIACARRAQRLGIKRVDREYSAELRQKYSELAKARKPRLGKVLVPVIVREGVRGKACLACLAWKPLPKFAKHLGMPNRRNVCTICAGRRAYANNPERKIMAVRKWQKKNPEKAQVIKRAGRRLRHGQKMPGRGVSAQQYRELVQMYDGLCAYCGDDADTMDHVTPLSRGGLHEVDNLVPACRQCNFNKHDKTLAEWRRGTR